VKMFAILPLVSTLSLAPVLPERGQSVADGCVGVPLLGRLLRATVLLLRGKRLILSQSASHVRDDVYTAMGRQQPGLHPYALSPQRLSLRIHLRSLAA